MNDELAAALAARLTALADDELLLAHRDAEWTGHAPIIEEDIALANLAQDELGHAGVYYQLAEPFTDSDADEMAFFRDAGEFLNVQMVEHPRGDWAFTMLRQYLFDAYEYVLLDLLRHSSYEPLAQAVGKIRNEELYHLRHTHAWVERLGLGTEESNRRMQRALNVLWPLALQLFVSLPSDDILEQENIFPALSDLQIRWEQIVVPHLEACELVLPQIDASDVQRGQHSEHLEPLLADLQRVARSDPQATW